MQEHVCCGQAELNALLTIHWYLCHTVIKQSECSTQSHQSRPNLPNSDKCHRYITAIVLIPAQVHHCCSSVLSTMFPCLDVQLLCERGSFQSGGHTATMLDCRSAATFRATFARTAAGKQLVHVPLSVKDCRAEGRLLSAVLSMKVALFIHTMRHLLKSSWFIAHWVLSHKVLSTKVKHLQTRNLEISLLTDLGVFYYLGVQPHVWVHVTPNWCYK